MSDELIQRLRARMTRDEWELRREAADEIERLGEGGGT